jgi:hypothetical protein
MWELLRRSVHEELSAGQIDDVGFDLRPRRRDVRIGLREFASYAPIAIALGLGIGFLHLHRCWPWLPRLNVAFLFAFFFIAVPEELFFVEGCRTCWSGASGDLRRSFSPPRYSVCRTGTSVPCISIGATCCWRR